MDVQSARWPSLPAATGSESGWKIAFVRIADRQSKGDRIMNRRSQELGRVGRIIFAWCAVTLLLSAAPDDGMALSEIEGLKYELLNARFTALQKEIDLLMEKYRQSREVQAIVT